MAPNTSLIPPPDDNSTKVDYLLAQGKSPFSDKTRLYHGEQNPEAIKDIEDLRTQVFTELPSTLLKEELPNEKTAPTRVITGPASGSPLTSIQPVKTAIAPTTSIFDRKTELYYGNQDPAKISSEEDLKTQIFEELKPSDAKTDLSIQKPLLAKVDAPLLNTSDEIADIRKVDTVLEISKSLRTSANQAMTANSEVSPEEISITIELPLEILVQQEKLSSDDIETLFKYLQTSPEDIRLWALIDRIAPSPIDAQVVRANLAMLDADLLDSILRIGSHQETVTDFITGQSEVIYLYPGRSLSEGGIGEVAEVYYAKANKLQQTKSLIKLPLLDSKHGNLNHLFEMEARVGKRMLEIRQMNPYDHRLQHILIPEIVSETFLVFPKILNQQGKSQTLRESLATNSNSIGDFAYKLSGMASGLSLLSENDIIAVDNKDGNYMESTNRGCLIDLGGFLPMSTFASGEVVILKQTDNSEYLGFPNGHCLPFSPNYSNPHLMVKEITGELPNDITHKFTMAKVIESYLTVFVKKETLEQWYAWGNKSGLEKLEVPPLDMTGVALSPAETRLYELYLKLINCFRHPFKFNQDIQENGLDKDYITLSEVEEALLEIHKM